MVQEGILFDGGMGQELVKRNSSQKNPLWSAEALMNNLQSVVKLHKEFLNAGSSVITLNSYSCTPQRLRRLGLEVMFEKLQKMSVKAAKNSLESKLNPSI